MIRSLSGKILVRSTNKIIVEVGGVGYLVYVSPHMSAELIDEGEVSIWTYLAVRETALDLYGFKTQEELSFFELLLSISGIGPKSALGILSIASLDELRRAIRENNPSYLTTVSGVGKKSAEKIVLELKDKVGKTEIGEERTLGNDMEAIEALQSLGYPTHIARDILRGVPEDVVGTAERLRAALKKLGSS